MMKRIATYAFHISLIFICLIDHADANQAALIICGSGGEAEFEERFADWGKRLQSAFVEQFGFEPDQVALLTERPEDPGAISNLINIEREIQKLAAPQMKREAVWIFLIGHGSFFAQQAKFHVPGMDLTAEQLNEWLREINAQHLVVLNASSSSAGFINALSGPGRIICTATKSVSEKNATGYMRFFLEGIESGGADRNFDERISFLEAASRASELTQAWYDSEGLIATEHSLLDDNGDQLGSRLPIEALDSRDQDGNVAATRFLKEFSFPDDAPNEWVQNYQATMAEIFALKSQKEAYGAEAYYAKLEQLFIHAATINRQIRQYKPSN
ncbi:MAG: hypothetical protein P9L94_07785 [Candidatus Hinthialibacter antarcticus]|nr:hypothetical protein [Candidatus Hinthialibacter antarcticus]